VLGYLFRRLQYPLTGCLQKILYPDRSELRKFHWPLEDVCRYRIYSGIFGLNRIDFRIDTEIKLGDSWLAAKTCGGEAGN
tara:strand:+ start:13387 stop:13626 length:240 start_codon:yes stop_codon:yes gene_type:complete